MTQVSGVVGPAVTRGIGGNLHMRVFSAFEAHRCWNDGEIPSVPGDDVGQHLAWRLRVEPHDTIR